MRVFQNRMLSGSPSRSRGPGSNSRKKSASWASKDRNPFGTILIGWWSETGVGPVTGVGAPSWSIGLKLTVDFSSADADPKKCRKSSAMSLAVEYRSEARLERDFRQ